MKRIFENFGFYFLFLILGLIIFFYFMFLSNFDLIAGRGEYSKYFNYILEHSWLWLRQVAPNYYFWSPPFNYPQAHSLALCDSLIGIMPFYWIFRFLSLNPFTSFQVLIIFLSVLNYTTFYYLLKYKFKFLALASSVASFVFAFSLMRYYRIDEISYFTQFYTILAVIFLLSVNENNSKIKNHICFLLFAIFMVLQFYSCFSLGFFICFIGTVGLIIALLPKTGRDFVTHFFKSYYKMFLFYILVIFLLLTPLSYNFVCTGVMRTYFQLIQNVSNFIVWIRNLSILDSFFFDNFYYVGYIRSSEFSLGIGIFTLIFSLIGLWKIKYSKGVCVLLLMFIFLISCGYSAIFLWKILYFLLPGSEMLDSITRVSFVALIILAFGIGVLIQYLQNNVVKNKVVTLIIMLFVVLFIVVEHIPFVKDKNSAWQNYVCSKKEFILQLEKISKKIPKDCKIIDLKFEPYNYERLGDVDLKVKRIKMQKEEKLFGMWVSIINNKRTSNGFLGIDKKINLDGVCKIKIPFDLSKL